MPCKASLFLIVLKMIFKMISPIVFKIREETIFLRYFICKTFSMTLYLQEYFLIFSKWNKYILTLSYATIGKLSLTELFNSPNCLSMF